MPSIKESFDKSQFSELQNVINSNIGFQELPAGQEPSPGEKLHPTPGDRNKADISWSKDDRSKADISWSKDDNEEKPEPERGQDGLFPCSHIPLTTVRLNYLVHLMDSVKKFV
jgi:hypothetical protein